MVGVIFQNLFPLFFSAYCSAHAAAMRPGDSIPEHLTGLPELLRLLTTARFLSVGQKSAMPRHIVSTMQLRRAFPGAVETELKVYSVHRISRPGLRTTQPTILWSLPSMPAAKAASPTRCPPRRLCPVPLVQGDLEGAWNFNILVSGTGAGWMHGKLAVDNTGAVTFDSFLDSAGNTLPPAYLFPALFLNPTGHVRDANAGNANFKGIMAASRKMIVGNASPDGASQLLAILQKQVPGITFSNSGDIQGFGNTGGGGRRFIYNQISSGSNQEWEFAAGQIGRDQKIEYTTFTAPSNPVKPGAKASILNIDGDGIVTESLAGALPQPAAVIDRGVMSADKSVIIGTATDTSRPYPGYILRIYQLINITANDPNTFTLADLAGTYNLQKLTGGASTLSASGTIAINAAGAVAFSSYADSNGSTALPVDFSLSMDAGGSLINPADPSLLGKLAYFKEMFVVTGTDSPRTYSLSIALKQ